MNKEKYESKIDLNNLNNSHTQQVIGVPDGSDVLEIGCSTGFISRYLKEKGCTVTGIEIDSADAKKARDICDSVIVADVDKLDFKKKLGKKKFDVITFGDVLEHLKTPEKVLEYISDLLKDDGYVLASVPNIGFGYYRLEHLKGNFNYERIGILDRTHLKFFDENNLYAMFESGGYYLKRVFRIMKAVTRTSVRDVLQELGIDDSDETVNNIRDMLDFEVFQYFVKAYPATEKNALRLLRDKEIDYTTRMREIDDRLMEMRQKIDDKDNDINALKARIEHLANIDSTADDQTEHVESIEQSLENQKKIIAKLEATIKEKDKYISDLNEQLQKVSSAVYEL